MKTDNLSVNYSTHTFCEMIPELLVDVPLRIKRTVKLHIEIKYFWEVKIA